MPNSTFLAEAIERGFVFQCTDLEALDAAMLAGPIAAYIGFDCTADSLHVGSLVQIMILRLLQKHGHKPVVLMGGGTSRIGDPSGKDESRQLLTDATDRRQHGRHPPLLRAVPALRRRAVRCRSWPTTGSGWTRSATSRCCAMSARISPSTACCASTRSELRLEREQPLTFLEFNYMILQSYDFRELRAGTTWRCRSAGPTSGATSSPAWS